MTTPAHIPPRPHVHGMAPPSRPHHGELSRPYTSVTSNPATTLTTMATARTHAHIDPKADLGHAGTHAPNSVTASQARPVSVPPGSSAKHHWARSRAAHPRPRRTSRATPSPRTRTSRAAPVPDPTLLSGLWESTKASQPNAQHQHPLFSLGPTAAAATLAQWPCAGPLSLPCSLGRQTSRPAFPLRVSQTRQQPSGGPVETLAPLFFFRNGFNL